MKSSSIGAPARAPLWGSQRPFLPGDLVIVCKVTCGPGREPTRGYLFHDDEVSSLERIKEVDEERDRVDHWDYLEYEISEPLVLIYFDVIKNCAGDVVFGDALCSDGSHHVETWESHERATYYRSRMLDCHDELAEVVD